MRKINRTIYITSHGYYLHCDHEAIAVTKDGSIITRIPAVAVEQLIIFGSVSISSNFIKFCNEHHITMTYVSEYGKIYGCVSGPWYGNVDLRESQYRLADRNKDTLLVRNILYGKFINSRNVLMRCAKDAADADAEKLYDAAKKIKKGIVQLDDITSIDRLRVLEGNMAEAYYAVFDNMLKTKDISMKFERRSRKPPQNNCNALLSLMYVMATNECATALIGNGLDVYKGVLHTVRSGRKSLACDLVEEFRSCLVDKFVINMINRKQIISRDFAHNADGIQLKETPLKHLLEEWEKFKAREIEYPLYNTKVEQKVLPYLQAQLLSQYIRGDIAEYPPFIWRQ